MSGRIPGLAVLISTCLSAATLRGTLVQQDGKPPAVRTAEGKLIAIEGERESLAVLGDARLLPYEIELNGRFETAQRFVVGPFIQTRSILVHKDGKTYTVSYWCPVCSIRSYTPGQCVCCHEKTYLDLQELSAPPASASSGEFPMGLRATEGEESSPREVARPQEPARVPARHRGVFPSAVAQG